MFGWEFPPFQAGGLATATVGLVKGLLRIGVEVTLVVPFPAGHSPIDGLRLVSADGPANALRLHRVPSPMAPYGTEEDYPALRAAAERGSRLGIVYGKDLFAEVERFASLAADIAAREPHDVIDCHDWITFSAGIEAQRISGKPLIAHIHATEFDRAGEGANVAIVQRELEGLTAANRVVSNSHALKRCCTDQFGVAQTKVDVVHWGIDGNDVPIPLAQERHPFASRSLRGRRRPPVVLFLGRVTQQKGPEYFIDMAAKVTRFEPTAKFIMAGSGDLLTRMIDRAATLGIADRIHFTGGVQGADVQRLYRLADVCVMPSVSEPFGLVALESLRAGTPCIMPRESGASEVVINAFKVDFWDVDEMTNKIVALIRHPVLRAELGRNGREELETARFGLEEPARLTRAAYRRAMSRMQEPVHA
ncbi:MAG: glycosyltransferase family 4 protein [Gemmatimonadota bacterium]